MKSESDETAWMKEMKKKVEEEMLKKEIEMILYWKGELEKILLKRRENLATMQLEIQNLLQRMQNRVKAIKGSFSN